MRKFIKILTNTLVAFTVFIFVSCTKEKVPIPPEPDEPTKWEKIAGDYKVYDTLGSYLYQMKIRHFYNSTLNVDSLYFNNVDGNFSFGKQQSIFTGDYSNFFQFGHHILLKDKTNKRWKMVEVGDLPYNNYNNDTIKLKFRITNINYYLEDITPYRDTTKIQIAVKQH